MRALLCICGVILCLLVGGCNEEVYSNLEEDEANEMLATLIANGVSATKTDYGKSGFSVHVDSNSMLRAIVILKDAGFPKRMRDSIGTLFPKSGIISSPFEERVRYIYALSEDIANTLSKIDGVLTSRVHIVLPEKRRPGQEAKPSSASVFLRYQPGVDLEFFIPQIRRLVSSAIEGLEYSSVTVVLKESTPTKMDANQEKLYRFMGLSIRYEERLYFWRIIGVVIVILLGLIVSNFALLFFLIRERGSNKHDVSKELEEAH